MRIDLLHLTFGSAEALPPLLREVVSEAHAGFQTMIVAVPREDEKPPRDEPNLHYSPLHSFFRRCSVRQTPILKLLRYGEFFFRACLRLASTPCRTLVAHDLPALPPAFVVAKFFSRRLAYRAHELWMDHAYSALPLPGIWKMVERLLAPRADAVIVPGEERAMIYQVELGLRDMPFILRNVPPEDCLPRTATVPQEEGKGGGVTVLYQGLFHSSRCLLESIEAFSHLPASIRFTLIGAGDPGYTEAMKHRAESLGLRERVRILPRVPYVELAAYTVGADIGILLYRNDSRNDYYCAPNKLYEYLHAGLAPVASDFPGLRRELAAAGAGVCVIPFDPADIARGIAALVSDEEKLAAMKRRARTYALRSASWGREYRRLEEFYRLRGFV